MSLHRYTPEFKRKVIDLHKKCGRTYKSIVGEYGVSKASISRWCSESNKECQGNFKLLKACDLARENLRLKRENRKLRKIIEFFKKIIVLFVKEIKC